MTTKLFAPPEYWEMKRDSPKLLKKVCNGAGPKGFGFIIPDTLWGLRITEAANIHDYQYSIYHLPWSNEERDKADRIFLNNMQRIIEAGTKWGVLKWLRYRRAKTYYNAVHIFGGPAYWSKKNKKSEEGLVECSSVNLIGNQTPDFMS